MADGTRARVTNDANGLKNKTNWLVRPKRRHPQHFFALAGSIEDLRVAQITSTVGGTLTGALLMAVIVGQSRVLCAPPIR